jgi:hypothetical protein
MNQLVIRATDPKVGMTYRDVLNALKRAEQMGVDMATAVRVDIAPFDIAGVMSGQGSPLIAIKIPLKDDDSD